MNIINLKKIIPVTAIACYSCLIAVGSVTENYFLLTLTLFPVFILGTLAIVLGTPCLIAKPMKIDELPSRMRNKMIYRLSLILIAGIIGLNFIANANSTLLERILASIILILGFIPTLLYYKHNDKGVPFLPLFGIIYSIYYGLPIFFLEDFGVFKQIYVPQASVEKALLHSIIGLLCLYLTYYVIPGKSIYRHLPRVSIYWNIQKAKFWAILFTILGLGVNYVTMLVHVPLQFQQVILFLARLSFVGIGILYILQLQGYLNKAAKALLWCVFLPLLIILKLGTGSLAHVLFIIIFISLTYWTFRRKIPWKISVFVILVFIVFMGARTEFRQLTWQGDYSDIRPFEKSKLFTEMAIKNKEALDLGIHLVFRRIARIIPFAHVVNKTPEDIPYLYGKTYMTLFWTPIPRILYPDKPTKELGQLFGHRYNFLHPSDYITSYNLPQLVEMYVNFGTIGVVIGMFITGIIYRVLYVMFGHIKAGEGGILIGLILFKGLSNIGSDFSLVFGGLFYNALLLIFVSQVIKRRSSAQ